MELKFLAKLAAEGRWKINEKKKNTALHVAEYAKRTHTHSCQERQKTAVTVYIYKKGAKQFSFKKSMHFNVHHEISLQFD